MRASVFIPALVVSILASQTAFGSPPTEKADSLIVHEWGTFLSVQGSDGKAVGGMVDSEEALPPFVDVRGFPSYFRTLFRQKMETPVTYFYTKRPRDVRVNVNMPKGLLTHWYPSVRGYGAGSDARFKSLLPAGSYLDWGKISLIPQAQPAPGNPPAVAKDATWQFARQTDSALIKTRVWDFVQKDNPSTGTQESTQFEKFLFYRGLGTFALPLSVQSKETQGRTTITLENDSTFPLRGVVLIRVENGQIQFRELPDLDGQGRSELEPNLVLSPARSLTEGIPVVRDAVAGALRAAGLYAKEAEAMVNTWDKSYFRTDGLRVLYILPRERIDEVIPIHIDPAPQSLVRIMVGRVEVLTPAQERKIASYVASLGSESFQARDAATSGLARLGRLTEPALRRVLATTTDPEVKARAQSLVERFGQAE
jgi:hypothetical protein